VSVAAIGERARGAIDFVAPQKTAVNVTDLREAIGRAYTRVTGKPATAGVVRSLTAQASLETAGGRSMYNFNFGGVKGAGPGGKSASCLTHEVVDGKELTLRQNFRAYASLDEGAEDYVRVLVNKFGGALPAAAGGDLDGFAHALKQAGYYTASENDYAAALKCASETSGAGSTGESARILPVPDASSFASSVDISRLFDALSASALKIAEPSSAG
jgi:hypothetical protein